MYKYLITILYALSTWYTISLFAFCLKSPEYHVNQNELFLPEEWVSSSNGLFPEDDFKLLESLRAGSSSDVAETRLSTNVLYTYCT